MNYEKKYNEALERAKQKIDAGFLAEDDLSYIFPELAESEDERMRDALIYGLQKYGDDYKVKTFAGWPIDGLIAYLEKQKEPHIPWYDLQKSKEAGYTILKTEEYEELIKQKEQKPVNFYVPEGVDMSDPKSKIAVIIGMYKKQTGMPQEEYLSLLTALDEQKPVEWKPQPESLEALMYAIEGNWEMIKPTSYLSRRLEDLYEGLINTYSVDEILLAELPKTAYTAKGIEELKVMKAKIDASMESPVDKPAEWSEKHIADIFEKVGLAKIAREQENDELTNALQDAMLELSKVENTEWSEEDEKIAYTILNLLCSQVTYVTGQGTTSGKQFPTYAKERDWFEKRFKSLRPHWKPSEEQMEALKKEADKYWEVDGVDPLYTLWQDLQKL